MTISKDFHRANQKPCVFCEKVKNRDNVYDCGRGVFAFEPLNPVTPGHMLFVHKRHTSYASSNPKITGEVFAAAAEYGRVQQEAFNLITSCGDLATQTVYHLHIHYVPRYPADGLHLPWTGQEKK